MGCGYRGGSECPAPQIAARPIQQLFAAPEFVRELRRGSRSTTISMRDRSKMIAARVKMIRLGVITRAGDKVFAKLVQFDKAQGSEAF
jgi:hypothetical protein